LGNRVLEIVVFLMSHIKDHQGQLENLEDVSSYLKSNGFTDNEISSAYSWVLDQLQNDSHFVLEDSQSLISTRILTEQERRQFSSEAIGYLLQLRYLGLISDGLMEVILERAGMMAAGPIDLDQLKIVISALLFREPEIVESGKQQIVLLPDDEGLVN